VSIAGGKAALASAPQVRKIGSVVYARGGWSSTGISAGSNTAGTIPSGYRPTQQLIFTPGMSAAGSQGRMAIGSDGVVEIDATASVATQWRLDTCCWTVD
jgi:hypothetical protein